MSTYFEIVTLNSLFLQINGVILTKTTAKYPNSKIIGNNTVVSTSDYENHKNRSLALQKAVEHITQNKKQVVRLDNQSFASETPIALVDFTSYQKVLANEQKLQQDLEKLKKKQNNEKMV